MTKQHSEPCSFPDLLQQLRQRFPLEVLPVERRPLWQAQQQPQDLEKVLNWIRTARTSSIVAFRDVFVARLTQPAEPAWSILLQISDELGEFILTVGGRSLFGPGVDYWPPVDVEAMTEGDLVSVTRLGTRLSPLFPLQEHYPGSETKRSRWESCVLTMGDAICLLTASFLPVDQWVMPPHDIGDLFNRRLYPNRVVVCLRYGESAVFLATAPARVASLLAAVQALEERVGELLAKARSSSTPAQHQVECYRIRGVGMAVVSERRAFVKIPAYTSWAAEDAVAALLCTPTFGTKRGMDRLVSEFGGMFRRPRSRNCFEADLQARSLRGLPCPQGPKEWWVGPVPHQQDPEQWEVVVFGNLVHHEAAFLNEGHPQWSVDCSATKQLQWLSPQMAHAIVRDWDKRQRLDLTGLKSLSAATARILAQAERKGVWLELSDAVAATFAKFRIAKQKSRPIRLRFQSVGHEEEDAEFKFDNAGDALLEFLNAILMTDWDRADIVGMLGEWAQNRFGGQDEAYWDYLDEVSIVCDFELVITMDSEDRIHYMPFQLLDELPAPERAEYSRIWAEILARAPQTESARKEWQISVTVREFLGRRT